MFSTFILHARRVPRADIVIKHDVPQQKVDTSKWKIIADNPEDIKCFLNSIAEGEAGFKRNNNRVYDDKTEYRTPKIGTDSMMFGDDPV